MSLMKAIFVADFAKFTTAVDQATTQLKAFESNTARIDKTLARFGDQFSGRKIMQDATLMAKAIEDIGGVARLTERELQQVGSQATEAIEKMRAMGEKVPPGLQKIADAATLAKTSIDKVDDAPLKAVSTSADAAGKSLFSMEGIVNKLGPAMAATFSIGAITAFAKEIGGFAGEMTDLSAQTGITTDRLQELNYVGAGVGLTIQDITGSVQQLQKRLAGDDKSAAAALERLGLSIYDIERMNPDDAFIAIADAMGQVGSAAERTKLAMDLYGRSGSKMTRLFGEDIEGLMGQARAAGAVISKEMIEKADAFDDAWSQAIISVKATIIEFVGFLQREWANLSFRGPQGAATSAGAAFIDKAVERFQTAFGTLSTPLTSDVQQRLVAGARDAITSIIPSAPGGKAPEPGELMRLEAELTKRATDSIVENKKRIEQADKDLTEAAEEAAKKQEAWLYSVRAASGDLRRELAALSVVGGTLPPAIRDMGEELARLPSFDLGRDLTKAVPPRIVSQAASAAVPVAQSFSSRFGDTLSKSLGPAILGALQGGGNVLKSIGGVVGASFTSELFGKDSDLMKSITSGLPKMLGGLASSILPGIGALAGPAIEGIGKLFGKMFKSEGKKVNDLRDDWITATFGTSDNLRKLAHEAGVSDSALRRLFSVSKVKDFEAAADAVSKALGGFADEQAADAARLESAIAKYGFSLEQLGPVLQRSKLDEQAKELIEDWRVLVAAGVDMTAVNENMSESINEFLQTAIRTGTEIPRAFQPILERMAKQGTLTDEAGNAITDLQSLGIQYADTMTQGFDRVVKKLDELIGKLGGVADAVADIPDQTIDIGVRYHTEGPNEPPGPESRIVSQSLPGFQQGSRGRYLDFGAGTPVMLHGKERIVTEDETTVASAQMTAMLGAVSSLQTAMVRALRENALQVRDQTQLAIARA